MRILLLLLAVAAGSAEAQVFRCVTAEGRTLYSDSACPSGSKGTDISTHVGECTDEQCRTERERRTLAAQEQLLRDREALATMTDQRRKAEADALEELRRLTAIDARLAAEAEAAAQPYTSWPVYPWFPAAPCVGPCARPPIKPDPPRDHPVRPRQPPVSLRDPPR
jgi:hypothetical protein